MSVLICKPSRADLVPEVNHRVFWLVPQWKGKDVPEFERIPVHLVRGMKIILDENLRHVGGHKVTGMALYLEKKPAKGDVPVLVGEVESGWNGGVEYRLKWPITWSQRAPARTG